MEGSFRLHDVATPDLYPSAPVEMATAGLTEADLNAFDSAYERVSGNGYEPTPQSIAEILVDWPENLIAVLIARRGM